MVRDLLSFSECGQHFAFCGPDGKLKLWDTVTGALKQEYLPNVHLNSPCSTLLWMQLSKTLNIPWKNRKRKHEGKITNVIALGTFKGAIALYSVSEGNVVTTLNGGHKSPVSCICWAKEAGLFSAANNVIVHWDLVNKSIKSKWKCGKKWDNITNFVVSDDGELCVTANYKLQLWQVKSHTLLKTFVGHGSEVTSLILVGKNYVISSAENDREISAWNLNGDSEQPVARFILPDTLKHQMCVIENGSTVQIMAVSNSGVLYIFHQQLNGQVKTNIKPKHVIEIAAEKGSGSSVASLPILCGCFKSPTSICFVYGYSPKFVFEYFDTDKGKDANICLVRPDTRQQQIVTNTKVESTICSDAQYVNGGIKRKLDDDPVDVPMEERLGNLCIDSSEAGTAKASPYNMAQLLIQGLESKDRSILESVLFRKDPQVISETVSRLPLQSLSPLIKELTNMVQGRSFVSFLATSWLKCVLASHASYLLSDQQTCKSLGNLHSLMESRLLVLPPLTSLSGRLDLLLQQLEETPNQNVIGTEALVVYQDEDSSDDAKSSMLGVDGGSESEDRWEELSDDEVASEDVTFSG